MKLRLLTYAFTALVLLAAAAPAAAQDNFKFQGKSIKINRIETKYPKVRFYFTELNSAGELEERASKFYRLSADGSAMGSFKTAKPFAETGESLAVVFVLQVSSAMGETLAETKRACKRLVKIFGSSIKAGLVTYTTNVIKRVPVSEPKKMLAELATVQVEDTMKVKMEEGIKDAMELLDRDAPGNKLPAHRVVIVISDGLTLNLKEAEFTELGRRAAQQGLVVHSIGYSMMEPLRLRSLYELSKAGNGSFRQVSDPTKMGRALLQLQNEMQKQVVAEKELTDYFDGKEHDFAIRVSGSTLNDQETVPMPQPPKTKGNKDGGAEGGVAAGDGGEPGGGGCSGDPGEGPSTWTILGIVFGGVFALTMAILGFMWIWLRGGKKDRRPPPPPRPKGGWPIGGEDGEEEDEDEDDYDDEEDEEEDDDDDDPYPSTAGPVGGPVGGPVAGPVGGPVAGPVGGPVAGPVGNAVAPVGMVGAVPEPRSGYPATSDPAPINNQWSDGSAPVGPSVAPGPVGYHAPEPPGVQAPVPQNFAQPLPQPDPMGMSGTGPMELAPQAPAAPPMGQSQAGLAGLPSPDQFMQNIESQAPEAPPSNFAVPNLPPPSVAPAAGQRFVVDVPPPSSYLASIPAAPGSGIAVSNQSNLEILPAGGVLAQPQQSTGGKAANAGGWDSRQTVVFSMSELEQSDLVAWIVPLDDPSFPTLRIHDEFVLGSDPGCNCVVQGASVEPRHAILDLDAQGYWLRYAAHERATDSQLLQDGDRFRVGDNNFLFKIAVAFTELPKSPSRLEVLDGMDKGRTIPLQDGVTMAIGSHPSCAVVIRGEGVGHRHALAIRQGDTCYVEDLGAEGGVSFDNALVGSKGLKSGQEIVLGRVRIIFVHGETEPV